MGRWKGMIMPEVKKKGAGPKARAPVRGFKGRLPDRSRRGTGEGSAAGSRCDGTRRAAAHLGDRDRRGGPRRQCSRRVGGAPCQRPARITRTRVLVDVGAPVVVARVPLLHLEGVLGGKIVSLMGQTAFAPESSGRIPPRAIFPEAAPGCTPCRFLREDLV